MAEETRHDKVLKYWENRILRHEYFLLGSVGVVLGFTFQYAFPKPYDEFWWLPVIGWVLLWVSLVSGVGRQYFVLLLLSIDGKIANLEDNKSKEPTVDNSQVDKEIEKHRGDYSKYEKIAVPAIWIQLITFLLAIFAFVIFKSADLYLARQELSDFAIKEYNVSKGGLEESIKELLKINGYEFYGYNIIPRPPKATLAKIDYAAGNSIKTIHAVCRSMRIYENESYWKIELVDKATFDSF